ncbi:tryptophan synthase beta subunit-like PLP-dependent enzyme [Phakopsora pachyrhizi]|uniref:Tryptophan synthase beta subunit-like PLP-dependent enzyme n=1 Tax=Phakopsora pachyrhizi TaxID=170000 RepID=A0AAV0B794_PHAPC|nr:tryptophan synthase beta subunit-like PLP-dependent enzyme [Phakopsora pachyrhizi]
MSGMMKKITRESKLSLQVHIYDYLVNLRAGSPYRIFGLMSGIPMMIGGHKSDWVVTGMFSTRDDLRARDPTDQLVEGPYCQTEVVQVMIKLRARQSSLDGMGEQTYTTGPEIWQQTKKVGGLDGFVCLTGTGGTLDGVTRYLKGVSNGKVRCFLADPPGSVLYSFIKSGRKLIDRTGSSITEEIYSGLIDDAIYLSDEESIEMVYTMLDKEVIYLSASSALNVVAAVKMAEQMGKGKRIVTMLCNSASKYQSRLFSKSWLESKNLYSSIPERLKKYATLA